MPASTQSNTFHQEATTYTKRTKTRAWIRHALSGYKQKRNENMDRFSSWQHARNSARAIKSEAIDHLDHYLQQFISNGEKNGIKFLLANNGKEAASHISSILQKHEAASVVKSKSMASEEIHLNDALEKDGYNVIESDLGEYILQLRKEAPYHIVFPAMHLKRDEISDTFEKELSTAPTDSPEELTMIARRVLRKQYAASDVGITGVNFAVAESGAIAMCTNEGNGRLSTSLPKIHIALMGIEKVIPKLEDLSLLLPMLATAGGGQHLTCYNNIISGPRQPDEVDGPEHMYVVIMDNRRTELLSDPQQRDALNCIRCGACLNVCPIFTNIGGHTYNTTYPGPIGSVITPHLRGLQDWKHLSSASSLCGACTEACPVGIDLHHHLLHNRRNAVQGYRRTHQTGKSNPLEKIAYTAFRIIASHPFIFDMAKEFGRLGQKLHALVIASAFDPARNWTTTRDLPTPPRKSFRELWNERNSS